LRSTSKTQYFVRTFSSECLAKNVLVNPVRSRIGLLEASVHQLVNSKLFEVWLFERLVRAPSSMWRIRVVFE